MVSPPAAAAPWPRRPRRRRRRARRRRLRPAERIARRRRNLRCAREGEKERERGRSKEEGRKGRETGEGLCRGAGPRPQHGPRALAALEADLWGRPRAASGPAAWRAEAPPAGEAGPAARSEGDVCSKEPPAGGLEGPRLPSACRRPRRIPRPEIAGEVPRRVCLWILSSKKSP